MESHIDWNSDQLPCIGLLRYVDVGLVISFKLNSSPNSQEAIPNKNPKDLFCSLSLETWYDGVYLHLFLALGLTKAATSMGLTHFATAVNMGVPTCPTRIRK